MKSVDHPNFKRLQALQNCVGDEQFLVCGGRQIKAALDAGYPLLEIWVPEQASRSLACWEEMASKTCVVNPAQRAVAVAAEEEQRLNEAYVKKPRKVAKLAAAAALVKGKRKPNFSKAAEATSQRKASKQAAAAVISSSQERATAQSNKAAVPVKIFTQELLKKLHPVKRPDALAVAQISSLAPGFVRRDQILILEGINDPFHLGTILRCAEAFGLGRCSA